MTDVAPWSQLTPQARSAVRAEIDELLREAPNEEAARVVLAQMPDTALPFALAKLRELKENH